LARGLSADKLEMITSVAPLSQIMDLSELLLSGKARGRVVVDLNS
jgi:hypothetical protein